MGRLHSESLREACVVTEVSGKLCPAFVHATKVKHASLLSRIHGFHCALTTMDWRKRSNRMENNQRENVHVRSYTILVQGLELTSFCPILSSANDRFDFALLWFAPTPKAAPDLRIDEWTFCSAFLVSESTNSGETNMYMGMKPGMGPMGPGVSALFFILCEYGGRSCLTPTTELWPHLI